MNENGGKSSTILLTVIGIATLLVVVTGATFAYFAAIVNGENDKSVFIQAGTGGSIKIEGGDPISLKGIYPKAEAWATQTFTVTYPAAAGAADNVLQNTGVDLVVDGENTFNAGYLKMKMILDDTTSDNYTEVTNITKNGSEYVMKDIPSSGSIHLVTGTRKRKDKTVMKYTLEVYFPEDDTVNQNDGQDHSARIYMKDVSEA